MKIKNLSTLRDFLLSFQRFQVNECHIWAFHKSKGFCLGKWNVTDFAWGQSSNFQTGLPVLQRRNWKLASQPFAKNFLMHLYTLNLCLSQAEKTEVTNILQTLQFSFVKINLLMTLSVITFALTFLLALTNVKLSI